MAPGPRARGEASPHNRARARPYGCTVPATGSLLTVVVAFLAGSALVGLCAPGESAGGGKLSQKLLLWIGVFSALLGLSLVAHVPRLQEVRLFRSQATGLSIFTQSLFAGPCRGLDHSNRPNEQRGSAPGIQAHSDAAGCGPLAGASAPG